MEKFSFDFDFDFLFPGLFGFWQRGMGRVHKFITIYFGTIQAENLVHYQPKKSIGAGLNE
jgi:hypothetical protein